MLQEDGRERPARVTGRHVDQSTEGPVQQLRLAERAVAELVSLIEAQK